MILFSNAPICPKGIDEEEFVLKYNKSSVHFIERLYERYGIEMTIDEYNTVIRTRKYLGMFSKNSSSSMGILTFKDKRIWVLYNSDFKLFLTVYPPIIESDINEMITACFVRPLRNVAYELYEIIKKEIDDEVVLFESIKDAAIHFFESCNHSTLLITKYKYGKIPPIQYCREISKIIEGVHLKVKISTKNKP